MKRFYKLVAATRREEGGFGVYLDGKIVKTPKGSPLATPTLALAETAAQEWARQGEQFRPADMVVNRLVVTAIDVIGRRRRAAIEEVVDYAEAELICHLADGPASLVEAEDRQWAPWRRWSESWLGAPLRTSAGLVGVEQEPRSLAALRARVEAVEDWALVGLHAAVTASGSLVLGLALLEGAIAADALYRASMVDEIEHMARWGEDEEARRRLDGKKRDLEAAASYLRALDG